MSLPSTANFYASSSCFGRKVRRKSKSFSTVDFPKYDYSAHSVPADDQGRVSPIAFPVVPSKECTKSWTNPADFRRSSVRRAPSPDSSVATSSRSGSSVFRHTAAKYYRPGEQTLAQGQLLCGTTITRSIKPVVTREVKPSATPKPNLNALNCVTSRARQNIQPRVAVQRWPQEYAGFRFNNHGAILLKFCTLKFVQLSNYLLFVHACNDEILFTMDNYDFRQSFRRHNCHRRCYRRTNICSRVVSLFPGRCSSSFESVISKYILRIKIMSTSCEIFHRWMPRNTFDDKSTCAVWQKAITSASVEPDLCWTRLMSPYGVSRLKWVNTCCATRLCGIRMTLSGPRMLYKIVNSQWNYEEIIYNIVVITVSAGGRAPLWLELDFHIFTRVWFIH